MKRTVRRQTVNHFIHTFMRDYDTEKAADRTMKSRYVPHNLKTQLVAAMSQCDDTDRPRIERVARLGMYIDSSCNELVYYNTITTAVMRWTVSLYVDSSDVKRIFEIVMDDAGRICDDDIHFIMEKYRYLEESDGLAERESGEGSILGFLKAKKHSPDTSLIRYYGNCLWLKILRAILRNSFNIFNSNSFSSVFTGLIDSDGDANATETTESSHDTPNNGLDEEARALYKEFRENRTEWLKAITRSNQEKIERSVAADYYDDTTSSENDNDGNRKKTPTGSTRHREKRRRPPVPPPNISLTAFDVPFDDNDEDDGYIEIGDDNEYSDESEPETVLRAPYTYKKRCDRFHANEPQPDVTDAIVTERPVSKYEKGSGGFGANTTVVAKITREKKLHILDDELKGILMEERISKALSTQTNDPNGIGSVTTIQTVLTKSTRDATRDGITILPLQLAPKCQKSKKRDRMYKVARNAIETDAENSGTIARFSGLHALPAPPIALRALPPGNDSDANNRMCLFRNSQEI